MAVSGASERSVSHHSTTSQAQVLRKWTTTNQIVTLLGFPGPPLPCSGPLTSQSRCEPPGSHHPWSNSESAVTQRWHSASPPGPLTGLTHRTSSRLGTRQNEFPGHVPSRSSAVLHLADAVAP